MKGASKYLFIFLCWMSFHAKAQNPLIDSLEKVLRSPVADTTKVSALSQLAGAYQEHDRLKAFSAAKQALELARTSSYKAGEGHAHNTLGDLYWFAGDYTAASDHYFKALNLFEALNDQAAIAQCYRNIGWIYQGQGNYKLTTEYYLKSLKINQALGLKKRQIANYDDLGIVYQLTGDYEEALKYCKMTIRLSKEINSAKGLATAYGNLGILYRAMGRNELAIESFNTSNELHLQHEDHYNLAEGYTGLAGCYLNLQRPERTIYYAEKALKLGKEHHFKRVRSDALKLLSAASEQKKEFRKAYEYLSEFSVLQDSTYNENNSKQINEMSAKYESDKKELLISSLEKGKTLSREQLKREQSFRIYLIVLSIMIVAFAFFLFRGIMLKKKANIALTQAYREIGLKNKDITDSINYSKRIQDASLPADELRKQLFPESFILFKPKDIVSGDFYWYAEKHGKKIIAACDCTGHGVPGALMSMIGNNLLHQVIDEKGITTSGEILRMLDQEVRKALKQDEHSANRDGMDIALLVFAADGSVEFSGAQRPLWIIHNNELKEIKGSKHSIGGLQTTQSREFVTNTLRPSPNDLLYIFSDGYADQFGGPEGKKFMTKNMKELLLKIHPQPVDQQRQLLDNTIGSWAAKNEQVDDILVIGIKIL